MLGDRGRMSAVISIFQYGGRYGVRAQRSRSRNIAYGTRRNPFELDSQRLHWANLLIKMTRLCILQGKMYEG